MLASVLLAALACPYGTVRIVDSAAAADYVVRFERSESATDCVIREVNSAPGPGEWEFTRGIADFTIFVTSGIADVAVYTK